MVETLGIRLAASGVAVEHKLLIIAARVVPKRASKQEQHNFAMLRLRVGVVCPYRSFGPRAPLPVTVAGVAPSVAIAGLGTLLR